MKALMMKAFSFLDPTKADKLGTQLKSWRPTSFVPSASCSIWLCWDFIIPVLLSPMCVGTLSVPTVLVPSAAQCVGGRCRVGRRAAAGRNASAGVSTVLDDQQCVGAIAADGENAVESQQAGALS